MSADGSVKLTWPDGERTFRLAIGQLRELQERTGVGPHALSRRIVSGDWFVDDLVETIRLGAIGGGASPTEALKLVRTYVEARPLTEAVLPAAAILAAALVGVADDPVGRRENPTTPAAGMPATG
ncbi:gene transfer agent family protein [Blastochloris tepida]|uniref:Gene transfer agent family protein n=1 Tax=Blastochloris tepida TaxID=2233851 RepID=A0A348G1E9_9HYPH|nr:gene transfer agent family protein [Blastochloris tepida]BBF93382.1 hypothetical protein BLTE_20670 [Blastochloris tepida]